MLTKRIIPCLDIKEGRVVKGTNFLGLRDAGDPVELSKLYDEQGADELVFLDITASFEKRDIIIEVVKKTAEKVFIPLTVGGGIKTVEDFKRILRAGADKISINTSAVKTPQLISDASAIYGSQCVVVAMDVKKTYLTTEETNIDENNNYNHIKNLTARNIYEDEKGKFWFQIYIYGGREATNIDAITWSKKVEELGAGEILLTSMDADGTKEGYDVPLTSIISKSIKIPVIASGGCGNIEHVKDVFKQGFADAALMASILHYGEYTVQDIKKEMLEENIPVRI
ncbi:imidazole glycerol phosphate synthase subunit HisF [Methanococcus voltae]|uniref:Imidazole glycerol phosphate synthase subunit HisF n=1 Tax=Methanococcus voltae (strain ATCC BAA-1334 / A3) TaxID=456320 RepID=D7DV64_METV3|nr:imidazole glycerol phosphate synthase subunit HisF [Methanococcus voltae]MCS3900829.1 cyclase [Methanococcus voltae]